jgi:hypothetical protein
MMKQAQRMRAQDGRGDAGASRCFGGRRRGHCQDAQQLRVVEIKISPDAVKDGDVEM